MKFAPKVKKSSKKAKSKISEPKVPYYKKHENLSTEDWQIALRKQFAAASIFSIKNLGHNIVFSDFIVTNPVNKNSYKVSIRGLEGGTNFCSCYDFKTNSLGVCKHIEAVLLHIKEQRGYKKAIKVGYTREYSSIYLQYGERRVIKIRIGEQNNKEYGKLAKEYFDKDFVLLEESYDSFEVLLEKARLINPNFRCYTDALEFIIDIRENNKRERTINGLIEEGKWDDYLKELIKVEAFPFQSEGISFACKAGRTLLADEMGLGKTLQALGTAEVMKKAFNISKVLIICPTSLKYQWKTEIAKFTNSTSIVIEGNPLKRALQYEEDAFYKIVSYNTIGYDLNAINAFAPDLVILDEAQRIKNWNTKIAGNVRKVRSPYAIVLTGTPLENKLEELVSLVQFVDPFLIGPLFKFLEKHQVKDQFGKVIGYKNLHEVNDLLSSVLVRRLKVNVLSQLPERTDKNLFVPMTDRQSEIHAEHGDIVARLVNKWRKMGFLNEKDRQRLMINMSMMRMVCDSTYIIDQETRHDMKIDELMCILDEAFQIEGQKVVVFSQWERMTRLVSFELDARKIGYEYLHGGIPSKQRSDLLVNFREKKSSRVFLSTDAGGVGLNLQSANLLINLDIPWNPAVLEQRIGRVYRYGQNQNVSIINLVSSGTIEHRMLDVLKFKTSVAQGVLDAGDDNVFLGEDRFNEFMKTIESVVGEQETQHEVGDISEEQKVYQEAAPAKQDARLTVENLLPEQDTEKEGAADSRPEKYESEVNDLFSAGAEFFNKLSRTMSDENSVKAVVSKLIEKDQSSGKSYLKIPLENTEVIGNVLQAFSGLMSLLQNLKK
ncbi:MAG: DEAD/DEAH box helicase [Ignavibacteriales bacterium]|nr:DEAD/DEAH box helicase [Ignavibacteriales bacterium]